MVGVVGIALLVEGKIGALELPILFLGALANSSPPPVAPKDVQDDGRALHVRRHARDRSETTHMRAHGKAEQ
jgi:hypothetical protein